MSKELELLEQLSGKLDTSEKERKEAATEIKAIKELQATHATEVKTLNETLAAKDATLKDIQDEVKELKAKGGRILSVAHRINPANIQVSIESAIAEHKELIGKGELKNHTEIKTVGNMTDSNMGGSGTTTYRSYLDWQPGMEPTGQFRFRSLVRTILSQTDYVTFPRANTPIGEGSFGKQATQGVAKAQVDRDYTMIDLTLKATAGYAIASRQSLRNILFLQSWLPTSMMEQLEDTEDTQFANALVAAATGSTTAAGITVNAEKLIYYLKNLIAAKFNPNGIAMDPTPWASLLVTKPNDYSLPGVVVIDPLGNVRILGRPVYPVNWLTGGRIIVGDWSRTAIVQSEGLTMRQSDSHANIFTSNEIAFLLERTEDLAIFRPDAFITTVLS